MGRCSYAPSLASELVLRYRSCLEPEQIEQIRDEVVAELKRCEIRDATLGHEIDHDGWWRLVERLGR
jgi:transposase